MSDIMRNDRTRNGPKSSTQVHRIRMAACIISLILTMTSEIVFVKAQTVALTTTTPGALSAVPTFDTIWVKATYTGDSNANNTVTLQYKVMGSSTWVTAYSPPVDRRSSVHGGISNLANQYQFRAGIFGLRAGESYDLRLTYADPDGVSGVPILSGSVRLLSSTTVSRSGGTYYLDAVDINGNGTPSAPFNSFSNAFAATNCGDKLIVRPGTYTAFTFSKSCSASTWYEIEAETPLSASLNNASGAVILVSGNFIKISGLKIPTATCSGVRVSSSSHDVWLESLRIEDVGTSVVSKGHAASYGCDGIRMDTNTHHVYVLNNTILGQTLTTLGPPSPPWDACCNGIGLEGAPFSPAVFVYKGNTITGGFRDAIGNSNESPPGGADYTDVLNNTINNYVDDGIQIEGTDVNLLVQGNNVASNVGLSCFAAETGYYGPIYWLRNTCRLTTPSSAGTAFKVGGLQNGFIFHNSIETVAAAHDCVAGAQDTSYLTVFNNIFKCQANPLYQISATGTRFNRNIYYRDSGATIAASWNGSYNYDFSGFQGIGQETFGKFSNPFFVDSALHIDNTSPAFNAGALIPNINDANSAWPMLGGGVDIGAFEVGGLGTDATPPSVPLNVRVH